jgi:hypothetical protein
VLLGALVYSTRPRPGLELDDPELALLAVLVGFDRGGGSPKSFAYMDAAGFDVLTWRKGSAEDVDEPCSPT